MTRIFMSAGEPSGVNIAAALMRTLNERIGDIEFAGLGGQGMVDEGMHQIFDPARTATMWLWGNLQRIPAHRRALHDSIAYWEQHRPDLMITVDYQAFHLYLGSAARQRGIKVLHYVSSQFWGRRLWTLEPIRRAYDHVLCIHEFEKPYYDAAGIPATFVGHPLFERLRHRQLDQGLIDQVAALPSPKIALLPGSRRGEITKNLPLMLDAARRLQPSAHLVVSCGRPDSKPLIEELVAGCGIPVEVIDYGTGEALTACDAAMITSGSASMEAVYYGCPCVILYKIDLLNYYFAKPHIASYIGQPNLIAEREVAPEFLTPSGSGRKIAKALQHVLDSEDARRDQLDTFAAMKAHLLDGPPPTERAADVAQALLGESLSGSE